VDRLSSNSDAQYGCSACPRAADIPTQTRQTRSDGTQWEGGMMRESNAHPGSGYWAFNSSLMSSGGKAAA
jgi:hypothetical protein